MLQLDSAQPINKKGLKDIDCPLYGDCLTHAAKLNWKCWSCKQCRNLSLKLIYQKFRFLEPYYGLLAEIYPEFKRKYEPVMDMLQSEP